MDFRNVTAQESREDWELRVLAAYPHARFYRYHDGGMCALSESPFQPENWSPRWRVGQWSRNSGGNVHVPDNLPLHLAATEARVQWFNASVDTYYASADPPLSSVPFCRIQ